MQASEAPDGGVRFHVSYGGREAAFSCEQLMAMVLADLRAMAIKGADGAEVAGCVLSVPAYFTQAERRAMLAAAEVRTGVTKGAWRPAARAPGARVLQLLSG